jgi:hypothetical protein
MVTVAAIDPVDVISSGLNLLCDDVWFYQILVVCLPYFVDDDRNLRVTILAKSFDRANQNPLF